MTAKRKRIGLAVVLALLISSNAATNEIYQWTDVNGVLHFTDTLSAVPQAARNSAGFIVRRDLTITNIPEVRQMPVEPLVQSETARPAEPVSIPSEPLVTVYAPQEVTIVVVNSTIGRPKHDPCKFGAHCSPVFRPDFSNRQYIHPSVFNGGSRQYIQPRLFNSIPRHHITRR